MITVKISVEQYLAEYARGKFFDSEAGCVRFPSDLDIYVAIYDLLRKRPAHCPPDMGNLEIALPCRREGKDPVTYNYLSDRAEKILGKRLAVMMWAELHEYMDESKHLRGEQFKDSVYTFMCRYGIESLTEDAMLKNYQRWRDKLRRKKKRGYNRR